VTTVAWCEPAKKSLAKLDAATARRVIDAVTRYAETGHGDVKKLRNILPATFRLRAGDYRVLFAYDMVARTVLVRDVLHRREAYR
jgi:mRNA-degrading endonuclease RelE of RelBE toxin-antitoxin system